MSSIFKIDRVKELWKCSRLIICQTPGLSLWVALHNPKITFREDDDWERKALSAFEHPVESKCRCRDCRYLRIYYNR